jgi:hypothetical protein
MIFDYCGQGAVGIFELRAMQAVGDGRLGSFDEIFFSD